MVCYISRTILAGHYWTHLNRSRDYHACEMNVQNEEQITLDITVEVVPLSPHIVQRVI
jgi:hypothetical protein